MSRFAKLFSLISLVATVSAVSIGQRDSLVIRSVVSAPSFINSITLPPPPDLSSISPTDSNTIASTAQQVDQKTGPTDSAPPSNDVPPTVVTAVDGDVTAAGQSGDSLLNVLHDPDSHSDLDTGSTVTKRELSLERRGGYKQIFDGTGTDPSDRDASIQGTAYLTFTRLDSYDLGACEAFCDGIEACVFVNLFYEFNSDATYNPQIKCAAYGDIHTAVEKTNFGGQQLLPSPAGTSYVQQSVGYAADSLAEPAVPDGYTLVFGPTNGANNAPGYMGFAFLDKYDVQACANLCNTRGADPTGGVCQYFNIWRAVIDGDPTTYSCSMYYLPSDASTATNNGQGNLQVTYSRGYQRITYVPDGGFEDYAPCGGSAACGTIDSNAYWTLASAPGGFQDAAIFDYQPYARTGHSVVCLGSAPNVDTLPGTITTAPLSTVSGKDYLVQFFQWSAWPGSSEVDAFIDVYWNGVKVLSIHPGLQTWTPYQVQVTAAGDDALSFTGGSAPSWDFLDDVSLFLA